MANYIMFIFFIFIANDKLYRSYMYMAIICIRTVLFTFFRCILTKPFFMFFFFCIRPRSTGTASRATAKQEKLLQRSDSNKRLKTFMPLF